MTNLSLKERERMAYISGDTEKAALLREMIELQEENYDLQDEMADLQSGIE